MREITSTNKRLLLCNQLILLYSTNDTTISLSMYACFLYIQANYCILRLETTYCIINVVTIAHPVYAIQNFLTPHRTQDAHLVSPFETNA